MSSHRVTVGPLPPWFPGFALLGDLGWDLDGPCLTANLTHLQAAEVAARLHGLALCGHPLETRVVPPLKRPVVRAARTDEARRRRVTTPGFTRPGVRLDEQGRFSLTPEALATRIGARTEGRVVIDACCGAGGNTIGFARSGSRVVAVERDPGRLAMARHNAGVYGVADRVEFVVGDILGCLDDLPQDALLFVDPPWGDAYREPSRLSDHALLAALVVRWQGPIWAKVPPAFDPESWPGALPEAWFGLAEGDRQRVKFLLMTRQAR